MRHHIHHAPRLLVVLCFLLSASAFGATLKPTGKAAPGEVLVKIAPNASVDEISAMEQGAGIDETERLSTTRTGTIYRMHSRSRSTEALAAALQNNPQVLYAEPNYILHLDATPNDPFFGQLYGLKNTGQSIAGIPGTGGSDIDAEAAWNVSTGSASIVVGVVDTGIDYTHPDLAANVWSNPGGKGNAACAAGTHGYNAITNTCDPRDDNDHGTHVSGTIGAAGNNSVGVAGVNWTASIMGLKFLDSFGGGFTDDAIAAIEFAVQAKIDGVNVRVLSNSWGGGAFSKALLDEINKAGENDILFVASAGNASSNSDVNPQYPAGYNTPNLIAVAATDNRDELASFSNYGANSVHLGAPGVNVFSTVRGSSYAFFSGTSMAAPHVSGVAALVLAHTPGMTTAQVKSAILSNVDPIPSLTGKTITGGRLNAARALGAPATPEFVLSATPSMRSIPPGGSATYSIAVTLAGGFSGSIDLAASGLPSGASASFTPNPATSSSTMIVTASGSTMLGTYNVTITGTSGAMTRSTSVLLNVLAATPPLPCPTFSTTSQYAYSYPAAIAAGDFNRDGVTDLALPSPVSNTVAIFTGHSDGSFVVTNVIAAGGAPIAAAVGDYNRDGKLDLAVASSTGGNVSIRLGNGDGTFQAPVTYSSGATPFWVAAADFDGDGKLDLVTANNGSGNVTILDILQFFAPAEQESLLTLEAHEANEPNTRH